MTYTLSQIKTLPAPSIKKLLRQAGYSLTAVAKRRGRSQSLVSRVVSKHITSDLVWQDVLWALNHPRGHDQRGRRAPTPPSVVA